MLARLRSFLRACSSRGELETDLAEELRFHIEQRTQDLIRSGTPPEEARRRARQQLGGVPAIEEQCREARGLRLYDGLRRELRQTSRSLRKAPAFAATAIATVALCLGANLTIFAVVDAILIRPLPFPQAQRLATIFNTYPKAGVPRDGSSVTNYYERRGQISAFEQIALYSPGTAITGEAGATERTPIMRVTSEFFDVLGAPPVLGRSFSDDELTYQTDKVVILTDSYWRGRLGANPDVVGEPVRIDGVPRLVVGILPADFRFLSSSARLYLPLSSGPEDRTARNRHSGGNNKHMIARLADGYGFEQAQAQIDAQNAALESDSPTAEMMADAGFRSVVASLHGDHVAEIRPFLVLMQLGALALLLIGVVNLLNLLLIRANGRSKERAVRQALGAGRWHAVSEAIVETTALTLVGGLLGLAVGWAGIHVVALLGADQLPLGSQVAFDARLALVAFGSAIALGLVMAAPIAWMNLQSQPGGALQSESRGGTAGHAAQRLRHAFIVGQIAVALVLLTGTGLLALSLQRTRAVDPGFRAEQILTGQVSLPRRSYPSAAARLAFLERLRAELAQQPGVVSTGIANNIPFSGYSGKSAAKVKGHTLQPGESPHGRYSYGVDGDYFEALGFRLIEGRFLTAADAQALRRVCVVDEDFANEYWPEGGAIGRLLFQGPDEGPDEEAFTIVGVVGAVKQAGLAQTERQGAVYYPYSFRAEGSLFVVARTSVPPQSLAASLQSIVRRLDADLPATDVRSMESRIAASLAPRETPALSAGIFSTIALLLSAIGVYGVLSYAVAQRRREIGVRIALGARPGQIRSHFLTMTLRLLALGLALGALGSSFAARAMRAVLFGASDASWAVLAGAAGVVAAVAIAASLLPSNRAACIAPAEALGDS